MVDQGGFWPQDIGASRAAKDFVNGLLALSWWRYPLRRRDRDRPRAGTVPDLDGDRGGAHEAPTADSPPHAAGRGRGATVGPGVPADPGSGHGDRPADGAGTGHLL